MRIVGILLAAGQGSRFGGDKLLAGLAGGSPIGVHAARNLKAALNESVAVIRPEDDALARALAETGIEVTRCATAHQGMGASLAHAVGMRANADGWVVALADMPKIRPDVIRAIADAIAAGASIAAPTYHGTRGHPVGFAAELGPQLAALSGDAGARDIVRSERERVTLVPVDDPGVLADIDTPAQLAAHEQKGGQTPFSL